MKVGYHASHEQYAPEVLLDYARRAQAAGFEAVSSSDHFHPWSHHQGQSGFAWSWLGAALQATTVEFGVVTVPGQRYHPAILAQASATLAQMFPGRFWLAAGSGELLNEGITGERWPSKSERHDRLLECVEIMRDLWAGRTVNHRGWVKVQQARLYSRPTIPPKLFGAAITAETARWIGGWADGLMTTGGRPEKVREVAQAFREGGGEGKPIHIQVALSYSRDIQTAKQEALEQWGPVLFESRILHDLRSPEQFDSASQFVRMEDVENAFLVESDPQRFIELLRTYAELGFSEVYLFNVNRHQEEFIEDFGRYVLPAMKAQETLIRP
ncbi:MAG: TIGR03885 family FMN-dependent LLM class oxidoreductase [Phycisphaerae bacterium]|jgi:coenzyme F420-dependent glucose-6-phosphate dehydrogenase|nr:TIGR03885 family FMN-dependent LLM class oxidoreductase [Phycisphaerae bacterium]